MSERCRHGNAWPTVYARIAGFLWCPDCGAVRTIRRTEDGTYEFAQPGWLYPRGYRDSTRQLERMRIRSARKQSAAPGKGGRT